ncbi:5'-nucleotidase, lipoprotein e(P4) family [Sphingorhabdus sp.]|jgi:5'-nucleotidase (lipoprotein e(P4) family)|uniref:5'-nucleotidase, lipoprotein e(P4) family n=1 Tax=Sphingorhabdus sp. TaxID=1902408 RepID=UPI0037CC7053
MRNYVLGFVALALAGCATPNPPVAVPTLTKDARVTQMDEKSTPASPPTGQQWLYGSAEGSIASAQVYTAMTDYVLGKAKNRPQSSVIVDENILVIHGTNPAFVPCGSKPLAAVFDADETLIWNVGAMRYMAEQGKVFDPAIWNEWEKSGAGKAVAMPGATVALKTMRDAGVTIIANTNRTAANAKATEDALRAAGLGELKHGETLYLMGDDAMGSDKDGRRATIAAKYCVIALAGDQLGDFRQMFNGKRLTVRSRTAFANSSFFENLWGNGWFLFSNPVYGPSIRGGYDEIYTPETKWEPGQ